MDLYGDIRDVYPPRSIATILINAHDNIKDYGCTPCASIAISLFTRLGTVNKLSSKRSLKSVCSQMELILYE